MSKKLWLLVSLVVVFSMMLAACGGETASEAEPSGETAAEPSGETAAEPVTLRFFHKWPEPEHLDFYNYVIQEYEKLNPNVNIEMEAVADEPYKDKIRVLMASGEVPDIYFSWTGEFSHKFARGGQALDLTDAIENTDWKDKIIMSAVEPYRWDGKIYGVPMRINAKFMVYNKALFEQYGLTPPTTWDELLGVCQTLKDNGVTPIAFGNEFPWASSHYVGDFNAKLVNNETLTSDYTVTAPAEELFTDPMYVEALTRFQTLMENGCFNEGPNGISHSSARSNFIAGNAAMMYIELEEFVTVAEGMGEDAFGFFQLPGGTGGEGDQNILTGAPDGFLVSAKSEHPDEAVDFLKFLTSPEMGKEYVKRLGIPSAAVGAVSPETALAIVVEGVNAINAASGMALWMDTDMGAKLVEVYLPGMQALLTGSKTPAELMLEVQEAAKIVQEEMQP